MSNIRHSNAVKEDPWSSLKAFTTARIALGRTGTAIPLKEVLSFRLAHAHARDAVYSKLDTNLLLEELHAFLLPVLPLHSSAADRYEYLQRPDKGRRLDTQSIDMLRAQPDAFRQKDVAIIIADGLSATAMNIHTAPLLNHLLPMLKTAGLSIAPVCLAEQARVAIGDEIGDLLEAKMTLVLIGERPGLSAADSMGAYITFNPRPGNTDEGRNCISNIRQDGLQYIPAAGKICYLLQEAMKLRLSGVELKDNYVDLSLLSE
ncbi:ethanolamine ammonia-lyase subunit EutC [Chitinophaga pinensis]|uniref:Ethanolamine ammonia-lyase small subunit n=1 Tax=Chitinophaga pinensis (strain ATCC 43595 / DSM 2588 / LMG 13176 / NBRC 15968 / NCIMB 11800 / UQM 2034) TaxID=485918 RepID=A0A979GTQ7_CHIPD|nr:ethanolamine ammonia-lyase subunit EutC [Chitinophaga pinensis]ACU60244.1 Ethanolamine ammonia-lyase [Chitinophaga pinensis DSM 2588]